MLIVKAGCCGATKVIMPSCLIGEQGLGAKKKEKIILELGQSKILQKEIAEQYEISEASVSRIKREISQIDKLLIKAEIENLEKETVKLQREQFGSEKPKYYLTPATSADSYRKTALNNLRILRYYKRLKIQQSPQFKYFSTLAFLQIISRQNQYEFIIRC